MEIVVTGRTGKLGGALVRAWSGAHRVTALGREDFDLGRPELLRERLGGLSFEAVVNCAAMANPEGCEDNPGEAHRVNAESPGVLAGLCRERGARLVHISTDYVLDGREPGLKDERAPVGPINVYGRTKLEGEERVLEADPSALVCRVSWIFGTDPPGFIESMVKRAQRGEDLAAVADKFSKPTWAEEIGRVVLALLARPDLSGLFHLTHQGAPESWWSCGTEALGLAHELGLLERPKEVRRQRLEDLAQLAVPRPRHTAMDPRRLREDLGWRIGSWQEAARSLWQQGPV